MGELGYNVTADSEVAVTKPFPLFTLDAVRRIRGELFDLDTLANHLYSDTNNPSVIRGVCPARGRFIHEAWTHPDVVKRINNAAGIALTPVFDYEIGHTYVSMRATLVFRILRYFASSAMFNLDLVAGLD